MKPHTKVFARLGISKICEGIGLFAIMDIPNNTMLEGNEIDTEIVEVAEEEVKLLPHNIQELYKDFCPLNDGVYQAPKSFNSITPFWFLNHSTNPNCYITKELDILSSRDIKEGEELTLDYHTYSEIPDGKEV